MEFGSAFDELYAVLGHSTLKRFFLGNGLLGGILADVFGDVAESATSRQIHPSGSLLAGGLASDPSARRMEQHGIHHFGW